LIHFKHDTNGSSSVKHKKLKNYMLCCSTELVP
jgi:hypothetical protein